MSFTVSHPSTDDGIFRSEGFYKFQTAMDESGRFYFLANNKVYYSAITNAVVRVELLLWISDPYLWKKRLFGACESLSLRVFLCVRRNRLYAVFTNLNRSRDCRFDSFLVSYGPDLQPTVLKKIDYSYEDVADDKIYFFACAKNKVDVYHIDKDVWTEIDLSRFDLGDLRSRLFVSNDKLFSLTKAHELATGRCVSVFPAKHDASKLTYLCNTKNSLCFSLENDLDHLHFLHTEEYKWAKVVAPAKGALRHSRVCFSWSSAILYFLYFDAGNNLTIDTKISSFPVTDLRDHFDPEPEKKIVPKKKTPSKKLLKNIRFDVITKSSGFRPGLKRMSKKRSPDRYPLRNRRK